MLPSIRLSVIRPLITSLFHFNSQVKSVPGYTRSRVKFSSSSNLGKKVSMSEEEWAKKLTDEQYYVTRQKGTEPPFTGQYYDEHRTGVYKCVCCGCDLFSSDTKFDSGSGWPSFYDTVKGEESGRKSNVSEYRDTSHGMVRTEVTCSQCDAHLGHVFNDGPKPTGLRYCINSASLNFKREK